MNSYDAWKTRSPYENEPNCTTCNDEGLDGGCPDCERLADDADNYDWVERDRFADDE